MRCSKYPCFFQGIMSTLYSKRLGIYPGTPFSVFNPKYQLKRAAGYFSGGTFLSIPNPGIRIFSGNHQKPRLETDPAWLKRMEQESTVSVSSRGYRAPRLLSSRASSRLPVPVPQVLWHLCPKPPPHLAVSHFGRLSRSAEDPDLRMVQFSVCSFLGNRDFCREHPLALLFCCSSPLSCFLCWNTKNNKCSMVSTKPFLGTKR